MLAESNGRLRPHRVLAMLSLAVMACGGGDETGPEPIGPPVTLAASAGNAQTATAGQTLLAPIAAKVSDAAGRGVPNIPVSFAVVAGDGEVLTTSGRTNGAGVITATWRVGVVAGSQQRVIATLLDTLTGALLDTALFTATVTAGAPATIGIVSGSFQIGGVGQSLPEPLRVLILDQFGNGVAGATVTWAVVSGDATLANATTAANAQGFATNTVTLGQAEGDVQIRATVTGLPPVTFGAVSRRLTTRVATLSGSGFGIARIPSNQVLVSLIDRGQVERVSTTPPTSNRLATVFGTPVVIAADAAGTFAYVANMHSTGFLSVIDIASMTKVVDVPIPGEAHSLALSPRGDRVYVTNTNDAVFAVDVATRAVVDTTRVAFGSGPWGLSFWTTATDSLMYVTARNGGSISEVDMRTGSVLRTLSVGGRPHGLTIAPSGSTLYVADDQMGQVLFVNRVTGAVGARIPAEGAFGMGIAPDGNTLYVTTNTGYILVIDVASATVARRFWSNGTPRQIVVSPDGNSAMAANMGGWIDQVTR